MFRFTDEETQALSELVDCSRLAKEMRFETSLAIQWLRLRAPSAEGLGSMPGQGTRAHVPAATESSRAATMTEDPKCLN